jgi:2-polyprenyl-6-methoxyphenol hydroxylase-like FAD-dependent oxidoreductase
MEILMAKVGQNGIEIVHQSFVTARVEDGSSDSVIVEFEDGTTTRASLVVGADGIHSSTRGLIPNETPSQPTYTGFMALNTVVARSKVAMTDSYLLPCLQLTPSGAFIVGPHDARGDGIFVATQFPVAEQSKEGWDAMRADPEKLRALFKSNAATSPPVLRSVLENIDEDCKLTLWPFYVIPKLNNWTTPDGRIAIVGDAAHALPPTIGQGISQGLEDIYTLALVLSKTSAKSASVLPQAMQIWQLLRQRHIEKVSTLSKIMGNRLLPEHVQKRLAEEKARDSPMEGEAEQAHEAPGLSSEEEEMIKLRWLYQPDLAGDVEREWSRL